MGVIVYNGKSSQDYSILVEHPPGYEYPEKDYEIFHVPGRNGDIVYDTNSYQNVDREYEIAFPAIKERYEVVANKVSEWLHSAKTYARLEDSYEPEYYRMAYYKESNALECIYRGGGRATVVFNCKPQRFLKSGEQPIKLSMQRNIITNPTGFNALPIVNVSITGTATFFINGSGVTIESDHPLNAVVDTTIQNCYSDGMLINKQVRLSGNEFPTLKPGNNEVAIGANISGFEIIPNWWTI